MTIRLRVLSLGAGVQSTTLALMAAHGEIGPMPDCAIFADTQNEPRKVYEHLDWLGSGNVLPFPIYRVTAGDIKANVASGADGKRWASIPAYTRTGRVRQQCTADFKKVPIRRKVRELAGLTGKRSPKEPVVEQWVGISRDEAHREKPSDEAWYTLRHPLLERHMTRLDCYAWMTAHGYPTPPKSACIMCPNREGSRWRLMKEQSPDEFKEAVALDKSLRDGRFRGMRQQMFLHDSCRPLDEVDFSTLLDEVDGFGNECGGYCGV